MLKKVKSRDGFNVAKILEKREMEKIRERIRAVSGRRGSSSSDNSYSLEASQLDW